MSVTSMNSPVRCGLDGLAAEGFAFCRGAKVALLCNQAAIDAGGTHLIRHALGQELDLVRVLSPEHGLWSTHQDMEAVHERNDPVFGLPVESLYGDTLQSLDPAREQLDGVDMLLVDLPDVGTRYYTYAATLARCMRVASETGTRVVVLDRPNPINGVDVEGGLPHVSLRSYVGELPVPHRHGLTLGELACVALEEEEVDCDLTIYPVHGWERARYGDELGMLWVPPSPNMPTVETAVVYPGLCLLEGTNVSEGRGTTTPFLLFGAPWVTPHALASRLTEELPDGGFALTPACFRPQFQKFAGELCNGLRLHVTDRSRFRPLAFGIGLVKWLLLLHPGRFDWRREEYEFVTDRLAIDLLLGDPGARAMLEGEHPVAEVMDHLEASAAGFDKTRRSVLLYR
jgi:uncharacterized protein YbbC (DUF1343 family)